MFSPSCFGLLGIGRRISNLRHLLNNGCELYHRIIGLQQDILAGWQVRLLCIEIHRICDLIENSKVFVWK